MARRLRLVLLIPLVLISYRGSSLPTPSYPPRFGTGRNGNFFPLMILAWDYFRQRRLGPNQEPVDVYQRYEMARKRMEALPRYDSGKNRWLPPGDTVDLRLKTLQSWEALGPGNIGGRTRALLVHPEDPAICRSITLESVGLRQSPFRPVISDH